MVSGQGTGERGEGIREGVMYRIVWGVLVLIKLVLYTRGGIYYSSFLWDVLDRIGMCESVKVALSFGKMFSKCLREGLPKRFKMIIFTIEVQRPF